MSTYELIISYLVSIGNKPSTSKEISIEIGRSTSAIFNLIVGRGNVEPNPMFEVIYQGTKHRYRLREKQ